ncbi:MAG: archaellin/type IV pilin N-terminal domain-containing protein [Candidatus Woesearchaeota archaeon]
MKLNKRGISPLIATVLIIGFTVALAAVILIWGQSFTKGIQSSTEEQTNTALMCANDVKFSITGACYDGDKINITVKNDGNVDIQNFTVRLYKSQTDVCSNRSFVTTDLEKYGITTYKAVTCSPSFSSMAGIKQIELIPVIKIATLPTAITCSNTIEKYLDVNGVDSLQVCV